MNKSSMEPDKRDASLRQLLDSRRVRVVPRRIFWFAGIVVVVGFLLWFFLFRQGDQAVAPRYVTEEVITGTLVVKVSATGNLQPTNQVDVGSELSGIVVQVFVDENDRVRKGQVLARLDLSKLNDAVAKSRAGLAAAEAQVLQAQATVTETRATLARFQQVAKLSGGKVPSQSEMDVAMANVKRAAADEASARAAVAQARAALKSDETNVGKASIRSPIDGVVLTRAIEPGQTVAASFQAPVLFTIAEDLKKMELHVDVDEADVGRVATGQPATFTVDAWPGRQYPASISRVGYGAQKKEGVVSYVTVLAVDNDDLSLRPGMTGTAEITTLTRDSALLVPNGALRFAPDTFAPAKKSRPGVMASLFPRPPPERKVQLTGNNGGPRVWVLRNGQAVAVDVQTGATNGRVTEITGGSLEAGMQVITESMSAAQ